MDMMHQSATAENNLVMSFWEIPSAYLEHALESFFERALTKSGSIKIRLPYEIWITENEVDRRSRTIS